MQNLYETLGTVANIHNFCLSLYSALRTINTYNTYKLEIISEKNKLKSSIYDKVKVIENYHDSPLF